MPDAKVTHPGKPGLYGYLCPEGTAGWVTWPDDEWLTTDPPEPGMVVVEWFNAADPTEPSDYQWEHPEKLQTGQ